MTVQSLSKFKTLLSKKLKINLRITDHMIEEFFKRSITKSELKTLLTETLKVQKSKSCNSTVKLISSELTIIIMFDGTIKTIYSQHNNY